MTINKTMRATRLQGVEAIDYVAVHGGILHKYSDPLSGRVIGIDIKKAREIAAENPSLICCTTHGVMDGGAPYLRFARPHDS